MYKSKNKDEQIKEVKELKNDYEICSLALFMLSEGRKEFNDEFSNYLNVMVKKYTNLQRKLLVSESVILDIRRMVDNRLYASKVDVSKSTASMIRDLTYLTRIKSTADSLDLIQTRRLESIYNEYDFSITFHMSQESKVEDLINKLTRPITEVLKKPSVENEIQKDIIFLKLILEDVKGRFMKTKAIGPNIEQLQKVFIKHGIIPPSSFMNIDETIEKLIVTLEKNLYRDRKRAEVKELREIDSLKQHLEYLRNLDSDGNLEFYYRDFNALASFRRYMSELETTFDLKRHHVEKPKARKYLKITISALEEKLKEYNASIIREDSSDSTLAKNNFDHILEKMLNKDVTSEKREKEKEFLIEDLKEEISNLSKKNISIIYNTPIKIKEFLWKVDEDNIKGIDIRIGLMRDMKVYPVPILTHNGELFHNATIEQLKAIRSRMSYYNEEIKTKAKLITDVLENSFDVNKLIEIRDELKSGLL